ncbi:MAG: class I SAM-dependent methyltransferase [Ardenticatenaceae bacterium]
MNSHPIVPLLTNAITARADLFDTRHEGAFRLFNGFFEGYPELVIDLYARTIVLHDYAESPQQAERESMLLAVQAFLRSHLPWVGAIVLKTRHATTHEERCGVIIYGEKVDRQIREGARGVRYAIDLLMNRDASFYLDTRNVRAWGIEHLAGKQVLNTFAYTGSLGVAAMAGGASRVVHTDLNRTFLNVAKTSYTLNGFPINKKDFKVGDFWTIMNRLKRSGDPLFDCVFLDPPFFSKTKNSTIKMLTDSHRLINKVRPLINDGGYLVAINNSLFLSGAAYMQTLETLCADGYLFIEALIPVPPDITGYPQTIVRSLPVDPAPFNHATKIALLRVTRK